MKRNLILFVCLCALACHPLATPKRAEIDLSREFVTSGKKSDTRIIVFGTSDGRKSLLSGWADNEKGQGGSYQWAIAEKAAFLFQVDQPRAMYLHLRIKSFFQNPTGVYLNSRLLENITIDNQTEYFTIPLPADAVKAQTNVIELQFSELRPAPRPGDTRKLAAACYYAVITPSKYLTGLSGTVPDLWAEGSVRVAGKKVPVLEARTGGSLYSYHWLGPDAVLRFGSYYQNSPFAENDDYAAFSVLLKKDGAPEREIYRKRSTDDLLDFQVIPLARYLQSPDIYRIEFRLERNSIFNDARTGWLQPVLWTDSVASPIRMTQTADPALEQLRKANRDANVIIMLLDAGGAKHFGCYGYPRNTTPVIDSLAKEGTKFDSAYCQAVYTLASTASLMSGLYPIHHRIIYTKNKLSSDIFTMAEAFRAGGYATGTFISNGNASDIFGMAQGFEKIGDVFRNENYSGWGQDITDAFENWLGETHHRKFFAYLHYREPHAPFNPPPEWKFKFTDPEYKGSILESYETRKKINMGELQATEQDKDFIRSLYDANLNYADYEVGLVLKKLKELGIYDHTIVIVTADHGEAFWEHDFQGHNSQVYQESIHIPMVIKLARGSDPAKENANPIRTIDIYPTLIDLLDLSHKNMNVDGRSFVPYFRSAPADGREVVSQVIMERQYALLDHDYKYLVDLVYHKEELYNLKTDPQEKNNLVKEEPVRAGYFQARLFKMLSTKKTVGAYFQRSEQAVIDEAARENLNALGYTEGD